MKKLSIFFFILALGSFQLKAQEKNQWKTLSKVQIETKYDEVLNFDVEHPVFSDEVKALNGKKITLEGWMIPLDELRGENYFVLSSLPYNNCFFCGGAGPETVAEIFCKKKIDYTEKRVKVSGTLQINDDDPLRLMYILNDSEIED